MLREDGEEERSHKRISLPCSRWFLFGSTGCLFLIRSSKHIPTRRLVFLISPHTGHLSVLFPSPLAICRCPPFSLPIRLLPPAFLSSSSYPSYFIYLPSSFQGCAALMTPTMWLGIFMRYSISQSWLESVVFLRLQGPPHSGKKRNDREEGSMEWGSEKRREGDIH